MIKPQELRIGNYIRNEKYGIGVVFGTNNRYIRLHTDSVRLFYDSELYPIPITEDILLKAGFEKANDNEHYFIKHYGYCLTLDGQDWCLKQVINEPYYICYLKNLHQLQNLYFALTGEELTINF